MGRIKRDQEKSFELLFKSSTNPHFKPPKCATTTKSPLHWLSTMAPACARPGSPVMTLLAPSSPPSSAGPNTPASWSAWQQGRLRRRRGSVQERYPLSGLPHRARYHHQLGRYGESLASHLQQRVENLSR